MSVKKKKILIVFSKPAITHRKMLEGILRYVREHCADQWQVILDQRDIFQRNTAELSGSDFSGIIASVESDADRKNYFATGLPTVLFEPTLTHLSQSNRPANSVIFFNDHTAEGKTAAQHFISCGFTSFAFVGTVQATSWSVARQRGFESTLAKKGLKAAIYHPSSRAKSRGISHEILRLSRWLKTLPPHTALFAAHDERALQVLAAAANASIRIPEDLAVLGVDDDELLCSTASPPLSSIPVNATETGERIAATMHALQDGRSVEPIIRTCHTRIVTRQSTDAYANDQPIVFKALDYVRKHLSESIRVANLAAAANCSRRTLELKMRAETGISPAEKISELRRIEAIKLLTETSLPISEVAERCGYGSSSHLAYTFRRHGLLTPLALRRKPRQTSFAEIKNAVHPTSPEKSR